MCLNISTYISPLHENKQSPNRVEISVRNAQTPDEFLSVWDTKRTDYNSDSSSYSQVRLPLKYNGDYNFMVDWGDGSNNTITVWDQAEVTHTYASYGVYNITITGKIIGWGFSGWGDYLKLLEIQQWGCLQLGNSGRYFKQCYNLELTATDNLNLTGTSNLSEAFEGCGNLGNSGNMNGWDVSCVTDMSSMFQYASTFNYPIGNWNVSSVTDMSSMFHWVSSFNQPIGGWDVSNVRTMNRMFDGASSFNQPIGDWNVSNVTDMQYMFYEASSFDQPIGNWNVSGVTDMRLMFDEATSFNQPLGNWDVSSVTDMIAMF
ncbi:MAG: BspA family leucine-rich repeat surface protein [Candidatus Odinarchaeota archaeon]